MKILFLTPILPQAPTDGDRVRAFHFLRQASARHRVVLASFYARPEEAEERNLKGLRAMVEELHLVAMPRPRQLLNALEGFFGPAPLNVRAYESPEMRSLVSRVSRAHRLDAVYCYRLRMAPYALQAGPLPKVLDFTDSLATYQERRQAQASNPLARWYHARERSKLSDFEAAMAHQFDLGLMNSRQDGERISGDAGSPRILVVPNGVDRAFYHPARVRREGATIAFVGHMAYAPNIQAVLWFASRVMPLVWKREPAARFRVVGGDPPGPVRRLARDPRVEVTGYVDDVRPRLWGAAVSVCPLLVGVGRQNKVLESFALGLPVVATPLAAQGVEARDGRELLLAESADEFAAQVLRLMRDRRLAASLARRALRFVGTHYDWERSFGMTEKRLLQIIAKRKRT